MKRGARTLYIDATAGASGDMLLGAFVDLGVPLASIRRAVAGLRGVRLSSGRVRRSGLAARRVHVRIAAKDIGRDLRDVRALVAARKVAPAVRERALRVFRRLFDAEARAHGAPVDRVHLHEAGALDAIVDIVGACVALAHLAPSRVVVSPVTTGSGTVTCQHGLYPVPGPATTFLLRGVPLTGAEAHGERLTPTGAALLTELADSWGGPPRGRIVAVGHGAGDHDFPDRPNVLRMLLVEADSFAVPAAPAGDGGVLVLEFNVDDEMPQRLAYANERLFEAGALEVYTTPVLMKKGRTGHQVTVLARPEDRDELASIILRETSTLGLRYRTEGRIELDRAIRKVATPYGPVRVKVGSGAGVPTRAWPEYEDCAALARRLEVPLRDVQQAALDAYRAEESRKPRGRRR
jgi:uncharacterized protein (TIGR00299 family) protein